MTSVVRAAAAGILLFAALVGAARAAPTWQPATTLAPVQSPTEVSVALDAKGDAVAVWKRDASSGNDYHEVVLASYRQAGSNGWEPPVTLGRAGYWMPEVSFDGSGNATIAWISADFPNNTQVLLTVTRNAANGTWTEPVQISPPGEWAIGPAALGVDAAGDATVAWNYHEVSYRPAGGSWQLTTLPFAFSHWKLAVASDGSMLLAGLDIDNVEAVIGDRGTWTGPIKLGKSYQYVAPAAAIAPGGNALVLWWNQEHGNNIVYSAARVGGAWEPATPLSFLDGNAWDPTVAIDDRGDMLGIWDAFVDPEASFRPAGSTTWQRPVAVAPPIGYPTPALAMNAAGQAVAVWSGGMANGTDFPVGAASFTPGTGWGPAQTLGTQGPQPIEPTGAVAIDPAGDAMAVWPHYEGASAGFSQASLQSSVLDNGGPLLHAVYNHVRPRINGRARPGLKLRCVAGKWTGEAPIRFAFRWLRGSRAVGRAQVYRVRRADAGRLLACRVTATNTFGSVAATSPPVRVRR